MNRATLERMERSYRIRRWIAGGASIVASYLLIGCFLKSLYFIFQSSPISESGFLKQVFYQIYLWAFIKPFGLEAGERLWGILPVIESRDIFTKENVFLVFFYLGAIVPAGYFRLCSARIGRLNRLELEAEDDVIRDIYRGRGVPSQRPGRVEGATEVENLWTRREKAIDRYFAPLVVGIALLLIQYLLDRFA